jgi:hypothetical protein
VCMPFRPNGEQNRDGPYGQEENADGHVEMPFVGGNFDSKSDQGQDAGAEGKETEENGRIGYDQLAGAGVAQTVEPEAALSVSIC